MLVASFSGPIIGCFSDRVNRRGYTLLFAILFLLSAHVFTALLPDCYRCNTILIPLFMITTGYLFFTSTVWPTVTILTNEAQRGTAIGFLSSAQNVSYAITPIIIGIIEDTTTEYSGGFFFVSVLMAGLLCAAALVMVYLNIYDTLNNRLINN